MSHFPVLSSILSDNKLGEFMAAKYGLNGPFECDLFRTGVNHTYFFHNSKSKYIVRVYSHSWRTKIEIEEELKLLQFLKENNLPVSYPILDKQNKMIHEINAPEGLRYIVLFSFAEGKKMRFLNIEMCFKIGSTIANLHKTTVNKTINRITYDSEILLNRSYNKLKHFFSEDLLEMKYLKKLGIEISKRFENVNQTEFQQGIVHLDIWYDNFSVNSNDEITIFDFDNCGNGLLIYDIGYFCMQLFFIESDKKIYESKIETFFKGYSNIRNLTQNEIRLIPEAGASIYIFYLGVQAQRFDWSNIFLTENYLKMMIERIKLWLEYHNFNNK
ncbi:phosphotransferase [Aestuariibaculum lutulentum]|uniref:Phosphotransferase n=1 Tax=Aestuariibaculum lutulentum TaxID=2920935 RepID=A0ABS9RJI9_9FLAO|nr:phosphotransferase [Aestuariibaculum lutulentum]MCH4553108.1 phosphotransferase [Aestuariibaculum lutulentum]